MALTASLRSTLAASCWALISWPSAISLSNFSASCFDSSRANLLFSSSSAVRVLATDRLLRLAHGGGGTLVKGLGVPGTKGTVEAAGVVEGGRRAVDTPGEDWSRLVWGLGSWDSPSLVRGLLFWQGPVDPLKRGCELL